MMESPFMDKREVAAYLHCGWRKACQLCEQHGVLPINTSTRKGRASLLWRKADVMRVADILQAVTSTQSDIVPRKRSYILGKSLSALCKELQ